MMNNATYECEAGVAAIVRATTKYFNLWFEFRRESFVLAKRVIELKHDPVSAHDTISQ